MIKNYTSFVSKAYFVQTIALVSFLFLSTGKLSAQVKDSTVTAIYTDFKSYWNTNVTTNSTINPDSSHNLLAFTFRGKTYSTGVNNTVLNTKLGSSNYSPQVYKALPVKNIDGNVVSGNSTYLATAIKNDGDSTKAAYTSPYPTIHIADVLTDGKNGLDLGTGVTNLPKGAHISFDIKNLNAKAATDTIPDLVFTQIADPTANLADTIFFYDATGKVVGNKKLVYWNSVSKLGTYKLDLYTLSYTLCNNSTVNGTYQQNTTRDIRMVAFLSTEFGITNSDSAAKVRGIQINPNGTSDQAFIAYNTNIISIDVPVINTQPATQTFCSVATNSSATFSVSASSTSGALSYQWKKNGSAISGATSSSYTATGLTLADTANAYSVTVTNSVGSVTSDNAYITYTIVTQPANQYVATGSSATFTVKASGATGFQWYKAGTAISGATSPTYTISPTTLAMSGSSYYVVVTNSGGSCTSSSATLTVENLPSITTQPAAQVLCNSSTTSAIFGVTASSTSAMTYQWYKNNVAISGAITSSYTASGLTYADTSATYKVIVTNGVGSTTSSSVGLKYLVLTQPSGSYIATGSPVTFSVTASAIATGYQWQKSGVNISGATSRTYTISSASLSDAGNYTVVVSYSGGSCTSNAAVLTVENVPVITTQPSLQVLCSSSAVSATYSVAATSVSALSYQWYKNGSAISGATSSSYIASGLTYADTANTYYVVLTNGVGSTTSSSAGLKYLVLTQPTGSYVATGTPVSFFVTTSSIATAYQWYKGSTAISGATSRIYSIASPSLSDSGNYSVAVSYLGGTCTSNAANLVVENLPLVTTQPKLKALCNTSATSATYSVTASSVSALSYQWYKNGSAILGATSSNYTATGLSLADTNNIYYVRLTNGVGSTNSNSAGLTYLILSQPTPATSYLATGNTVTFTAVVSSAATAFQWKKDGVAISGADALSYRIDTVTTASAGNYRLFVSSAGNSCNSSAGVLTTSVVLYSKATGNISSPATWGVQLNGSGSTPVDFTRAEHTFIVANRDTAATTKDIIIAGTYDVGDGITTISDGTTLEAGRIIRSLSSGSFAGTATSGLVVHGKSDLYFDTVHKVMQTLTINTTDTVNLHTALDITPGEGHGTVKTISGVFNTNDLLTLKSDADGTASVGNSSGTVVGKVTVERFVPALRSWRIICAPVAAGGAPTIHDAWQEGAVSSTDDPHPGYGTHITYGTTDNGFDQNPQRSFSMKVRRNNGSWAGVPATNTTLVTDYPAYFFFIRGNRSYDIGNTKKTVPPLTTTLRTTGYLRQGTLATIPVNSTGFTLVGNPYASPVDFESVFQHSQNISHYVRIWNPNLGGTKGTGAYVLAYWNGSSYSTTPSIRDGNNLRFIQAHEGFFVEGTDANSYISFTEFDKDTTNTILPFGRLTDNEVSKLEINLDVYNTDKTTDIVDGVTYLFSDEFNDNIDKNDILKLPNLNENLSIISKGKLLTLEQRTPAGNDSLRLSFTNIRSSKYQFDIIPGNVGSDLYLFDRYLNTISPIAATDTSHFTFSIEKSAPASKASDRFVIVSKASVLLPVTFTSINAVIKQQTVQVNWSTANEISIQSYEIERSANGIDFLKIGEAKAAGSGNYNFVDTKPFKGINYYRVKSIGTTGEASYTNIASVLFNSDNRSFIAVYPNPVTNNHCVIELHNKPAGEYELTLTNSAGAIVFTTRITITENSYLQPLVLPSSVSTGTYQLQVQSGNKKEAVKIVIM